MKPILIALLLCLPLASAESIMDPAVIDQKIEKSLFPSDEMLSMNLPYSPDRDVSWVTDENRPLVVQKLRERYQQSGIDSPDCLEEALVRAGDWDAIRRMIGDMKDPHKDTDELMFLGEKIIPYLIPLICYKSETRPNAKNTGDEEIQTQVRDKALHYFLLIMSDSQAFPQKTVEWGGNGFPCATREEGEQSAAVISKWWEHNKDAILEKRYQDAKWLPYYKDLTEEFSRKKRENETREILGYVKQYQGKRNSPVDASGEKAGSSTSSLGKQSLLTKLGYMGIGAIVTAVVYGVWQRFSPTSV